VHAARQEALAEVRSLFDLPVIDPASALQAALDLAHARLEALARLGVDATAEGAALDRLIRAAKAAADLDVHEQQRALVQRVGAVIARAFGAALADEPDMTDARRARLVARFADELGVLEPRRDSFRFPPEQLGSRRGVGRGVGPPPPEDKAG
jgi:hypothetical protein